MSSNRMSWRDSVLAAVRRCADRNGGSFSRQQLIDEELERVAAETGSIGLTPAQTLSRVLQELRDEGELVFLDEVGTYRMP